ncbi:hypothetical protein CRUP_029079 [Coryphaenoides rupestris]|nr:hypothetical protein CRUP_029079 [Coryphaenoides rupestris]
MRAVSPLRPRPGSGGLLPGLATRSRSKSPDGLLSDMDRCYRLLRAMVVPGLPPDRTISRVDLLQHVIDHILDLQAALLEPGPTVCRRDHQDHPDYRRDHQDHQDHPDYPYHQDHQDYQGHQNHALDHQEPPGPPRGSPCPGSPSPPPG